MALVIMAVATQGASVGQLQIALRPLQRLDRGLLVDTEHNRLVGRCHVEANDVGRLSGELRIVALAPGLAAVEIDLAAPAESARYIARARPSAPRRSAAPSSGRSRRAAAYPERQDAVARRHTVLRLRAGRALVSSPARPYRAYRPRHRLTVRGIAPHSRAIERVERPAPPATRSAPETRRAAASSALAPEPQAPCDPSASAELLCFGNHPNR